MTRDSTERAPALSRDVDGLLQFRRLRAVVVVVVVAAVVVVDVASLLA